MPDGFTAKLDELATIANQTLPTTADGLRPPIDVVMEHEGSTRPAQLSAVSEMEKMYGWFTDKLGVRQRAGCDRIEATAQALRDVITVYRRADGQE